MTPLQALFGGMVTGARPVPDKEQVIEYIMARLDPEYVMTLRQMDYANWWWGEQPAEVAALRTIERYEDRLKLAWDLARRGFRVDAAIAVWHWDPYAVQKLRKQYGYTWVPSLGMPPVLVAPGLTFPGLPSYDPNNPPPGAILVDPDPDAKADPANFFRKFDHAYLLTYAASNFGVAT